MMEIGCAGLLVADTFCGPMRELPREGELLSLESMPVRAGGCSANVAVDLVRQGFTVGLAGCVGKDPAGSVLIDRLQRHGIDCSHLDRTADYPTSQTVILLVEGEDRRYLHVSGANRAFTTRSLDLNWLGDLKLFYLGGLFAMPGLDSGELLKILKYCREKGVLTVVDVVVPKNFRPGEELEPLLPYIDYFLPNDSEAGQITGYTDARDQLRALLNRGANTVIITQGSQGSIAAQKEDVWQCGAFQLEAIDPSGSGDAFASGIITGILRGWDIPKTLGYGSALGASATRGVGTTDTVFTSDEAEEFLALHRITVTREKLKL